MKENGWLNRTSPSIRRNRKELNMIQLGQPAPCVKLYLFVLCLLKVTAVRPSCQPLNCEQTALWEQGTWEERLRRAELTQGLGCSRLVPVETYIYGWRLCIVTYFPCPFEQGNESFNPYSSSVSELSSLHVAIFIYMYSLHTIMSEKISYFLQQGIQLHKKTPKLYRQLYISYLQLLHAEFQLKVSS